MWSKLIPMAADAAGAEAIEQVGMGSMLLTTLGPLLLVFVFFYFIALRPQRKREKQIQEMRSKIEVGDEIVTEGGIIGRVVSLRDEWLLIETGNDRSKIRIARWAVRTNNTVHDDTPSE